MVIFWCQCPRNIYIQHTWLDLKYYVTWFLYTHKHKGTQRITLLLNAFVQFVYVFTSKNCKKYAIVIKNQELPKTWVMWWCRKNVKEVTHVLMIDKNFLFFNNRNFLRVMHKSLKFFHPKKIRTTFYAVQVQRENLSHWIASCMEINSS